MPSWDKESISLFMYTDGQFWKFRGLKGMWDSLQTDKAVLSGESPQYGKQCWQGVLHGGPSSLGALLRQQRSKALRGAEPE